MPSGIDFSQKTDEIYQALIKGPLTKFFERMLDTEVIDLSSDERFKLLVIQELVLDELVKTKSPILQQSNDDPLIQKYISFYSRFSDYRPRQIDDQHAFNTAIAVLAREGSYQTLIDYISIKDLTWKEKAYEKMVFHSNPSGEIDKLNLDLGTLCELYRAAKKDERFALLLLRGNQNPDKYLENEANREYIFNAHVDLAMRYPELAYFLFLNNSREMVYGSNSVGFTTIIFDRLPLKKLEELATHLEQACEKKETTSLLIGLHLIYNAMAMKPDLELKKEQRRTANEWVSAESPEPSDYSADSPAPMSASPILIPSDSTTPIPSDSPTLIPVPADFFDNSTVESESAKVKKSYQIGNTIEEKPENPLHQLAINYIYVKSRLLEHAQLAAPGFSENELYDYNNIVNNMGNQKLAAAALEALALHPPTVVALNLFKYLKSAVSVTMQHIKEKNNDDKTSSYDVLNSLSRITYDALAAMDPPIGKNYLIRTLLPFLEVIKNINLDSFKGTDRVRMEELKAEAATRYKAEIKELFTLEGRIMPEEKAPTEEATVEEKATPPAQKKSPSRYESAFTLFSNKEIEEYEKNYKNGPSQINFFMDIVNGPEKYAAKTSRFVP